MTHALRFLPSVEADAWNGRTWYESKAPGLGEEFLRVFYACCEELTRNPEMYAWIHGDFRRRLLRRFPYAIYYRLEGDCVVIFGLFHCARDPRRIRKQLGGRQ